MNCQRWNQTLHYSKNLDLKAAEEFGYNIIKFCSRLVTKWGTRSQNVSRACFCALLASPNFSYITMELKLFWSCNWIYLLFHDRPFYDRPTHSRPSHNRPFHDWLSQDLNKQTLTNRQTYLQILEAKTLFLLSKKDLNDFI